MIIFIKIVKNIQFRKLKTYSIVKKLIADLNHAKKVQNLIKSIYEKSKTT